MIGSRPQCREIKPSFGKNLRGGPRKPAARMRPILMLHESNNLFDSIGSHSETSAQSDAKALSSSRLSRLNEGRLVIGVSATQSDPHLGSRAPIG
jgi:hypothetical protein